MQNREKIKTFKKESKVVWFLCFFSFKAIFKLNVVWQNFEQTLNFYMILYLLHCWCHRNRYVCVFARLKKENKNI